MPKNYSYDPECKKLAEYFITDAGNDPAGIPDLAQTIQDAVEDWLGHPTIQNKPQD